MRTGERATIRSRPRRWPPLGTPLLAALAGILAADWLDSPPAVWAAALGLAVPAFALRQSAPPLFLAVLSSFALMHALRLDEARRFPWRDEIDTGRTLGVTATGVVADAPQALGRGVRLRVQMEALEARGETWSLAHHVIIHLPAGPEVPEYGDRIRVRGRLRQPEPPRNPGEFDAAAWMHRQGIAGEIAAARVEVLEPGHGNPLTAAALRARGWMARTITRDIEDRPAEASTIKAMVLGVREEMPFEADAAFMNSGTLHVLSVSGLHVGLFAVLIWQLLNAFRQPKRRAAVAAIPLVFFYALLTGWQPAAVRSAIMTSFVLGATALDRRTSFGNALCAAALAVLAWDTHQLFQAGCQLSFIVLAALALGTPWILRRTHRFYEIDAFLPRPLWTRWQRSWRAVRLWFARSAAGSLAALAGSTPLTLIHFQLFTPVSLAANILLVPLALAVLGTACVSLVSSGLSAWLSTVFNNANLGLASLCLNGAAWFASMPGAFLKWNPAAAFDDPQACRIVACDVGEGGAVIVRTAGRRHWMIDCASGFDFRARVAPALQFHGIESIDGLILTHGDVNHTGGAVEATQLLRPSIVVVADPRPRSPSLREALARLPEAPRHAMAGEVINFDESTRLHVLFPPAASDASLADDRCLVARLECQGWRILFAGDAGFAAEQELLGAATDLRADILVAGRHDRDSPLSADFVRAVAPFAVICAADDFPAAARVPDAWRDALESQGIIVFDQLEAGAVTIELGSHSLRLAAFLNGQTGRRDR